MDVMAKSNTEIYREVFRCPPDDLIKDFKEQKEFIKHRRLDRYDELIPMVKGHFVVYPMKYAIEEKSLKSDLKPFPFLLLKIGT